MTENTLETVSETEFLVSGRSMRLLTGISFGTVGDGYRVVWIVASRWRHRPARMSEGRWDVEGRGGQQERNPVEAKPGNGGGRKKKNREKKSSGMATLAPLVKMAWTNRCHLWCVGPAVAPCPVCAVSRARASVGRCFLLFFFLSTRSRKPKHGISTCGNEKKIPTASCRPDCPLSSVHRRERWCRRRATRRLRPTANFSIQKLLATAVRPWKNNSTAAGFLDFIVDHTCHPVGAFWSTEPVKNVEKEQPGKYPSFVSLEYDSRFTELVGL